MQQTWSTQVPSLTIAEKAHLFNARNGEWVRFRPAEAPATHTHAQDAETDVLTCAPSCVDAGHLNTRSSKLGHRADVRGGDARTNETQEAVKAVQRSGSDDVGDRARLVIGDLNLR